MLSRITITIAILCFAVCNLAHAQDEPDTTPTDPEDVAADAAAVEPDDAGPQPVDAEALFQKGRDALFRGQYQEAVKSLEQAVAADTDGEQTSFRLHLARAYRYAKQPEKSEALLSDILDSSPDHVEAGQLLAEIYYSQERWQDIADTLEPLLTYRHDYPTYHLLAEANYNLDEYDKSRRYYREAIKLNPDSGPDHYQLGNIFLGENQFARAAHAYESALRLGVESDVLHYKLASAYFNLRNYFGGITAVTVKAGTVGSISGDWYLIEEVPGQTDAFRVAPRRSAIFHVAKAMQGELGDRSDVQMLLANIYLNAHRYEKAYEMYAALNESVPEEDRALYAYYFAQSALGVGKYDEYLAQLQAAVQLDSDSYRSALVDAFLQVADKYNQAGNPDQYINHLKLAVNQSPQTSSLHLRLANAFEEAGRYKEAVEQWRMVLDLEPDHAERTQLLNMIKRHG